MQTVSYHASWELSEHHKETTDQVGEIELARTQQDNDGAFIVSGNLAVRPGRTYTIGGFGDTDLTVQVMVGGAMPSSDSLLPVALGEAACGGTFAASAP